MAYGYTSMKAVRGSTNIKTSLPIRYDYRHCIVSYCFDFESSYSKLKKISSKVPNNLYLSRGVKNDPNVLHPPGGCQWQGAQGILGTLCEIKIVPNVPARLDSSL